ncbi:MAG TPA: hypothetical protein VG435_12370 [Acidimicrobiales bacterium]|jgi:hypothetical protein|nr:hypothetical protein [Acidimicrobiales bacterium]
MALIRRRRPPPEQPPGQLIGQTPDGSLLTVEVATGHRVLFFLTSSCQPCQAVWAALPGPPGTVVITPSPSTESRRRVMALAPEGTTVLMSSDAWFAFPTGPAPWRIVLEDGEVVDSRSGKTGPHRVDGADDG